MSQSSTHARRERRKKQNKGHRNALKLPNTKSHRRRVSSQFSVAQISAVISQNSKPSSLHTTHSPLHRRHFLHSYELA